MSNPRWSVVHGKKIEIETVDTPSPAARAARKAKRQEPFAIVPLPWAAAIARETNSRRALVWIVLLYMSFKADSKTFPVSNAALARYGIGRYTKRRIFDKLEATGRMTIRQKTGCAPIVTLVGFPALFGIMHQRTPDGLCAAV
jgi:hypothetical protein